jgi:hypothetical protein
MQTPYFPTVETTYPFPSLVPPSRIEQPGQATYCIRRHGNSTNIHLTQGLPPGQLTQDDTPFVAATIRRRITSTGTVIRAASELMKSLTWLRDALAASPAR